MSLRCCHLEFHYPNGKKFKPATTVEKTKNAKAKDFTYSNRGMTLEEDLNETNKFYLQSEIAVIHKKPTPVQIVNVDYPKRSAAVIKEALNKHQPPIIMESIKANILILKQKKRASKLHFR